jgi:Ca-activated chloride channel family protein
MTFKDPLIFLLFPALLLLLFYARKRQRHPGLRFSFGELVKGLGGTLRTRLSRNMVILRGIALALILLALARPQSSLEESVIEAEGIDIALVVDVSTSMLAEDFTLDGRRRNRLYAAKKVMEEFIEEREFDRIGLVAFASRAYTVCPLTLDYSWLIQNLERTGIGMLEDGTAIGSGISSALNRLKDTEAKGKVVILLTDGINNAGRISPLTAAEAAKALGIKIYTIGAGTRGLAPYPAKDMFGRTVYQRIKIPIDEETLKKVARATGGLYFRATDTESLREIYKEIDSLEKIPIEEKGYVEYRELFHLFLIPGLIIIFLEMLLSNTLLRRIP